MRCRLLYLTEFGQASHLTQFHDNFLLLLHANVLNNLGQTYTKAQCDNVLDLVQTCSCCVEYNGVPIRLLAPIFDLIHHGSSRSLGKVSSANSAFGLEGNELVIRAMVDIKANDQVIIDYRDSA